MKFRVALKICRIVFHGYTGKELDRAYRIKYKPHTVAKAISICRRRFHDRRVPFIPNEEELHDQAVAIGCVLFNLAEAIGVSRDEIDRKKEEFFLSID